MYLLLAVSGMSIGSQMAVGVWLPVGGGAKTGIVIGVEGLLQFRPSGALLTGLTQLGAGLAQVP